MQTHMICSILNGNVNYIRRNGYTFSIWLPVKIVTITSVGCATSWARVRTCPQQDTIKTVMTRDTWFQGILFYISWCFSESKFHIRLWHGHVFPYFSLDLHLTVSSFCPLFPVLIQPLITYFSHNSLHTGFPSSNFLIHVKSSLPIHSPHCSRVSDLLRQVWSRHPAHQPTYFLLFWEHALSLLNSIPRTHLSPCFARQILPHS